MPPVPAFAPFLLEYFFELGPIKKDSAIEPIDIPGWEHVLGVEFQPWQARALLKMSRAYHVEMFSAREWDAPPPWKGAAKQWKWARNKRSEQNLKELQQRPPKEKKRDGDRQ
jgi:hypothetical protein